MGGFMVLFAIVLWFALAFVAGKIAENKGRSGTAPFLVAILFSPLVGIIVAYAMSPDEEKAAITKGKKKCPRCAEFVQPEAKICRFCQHEFTVAEDIVLKEVNKHNASCDPSWSWFWIIAFGVIIAGMIMICCNS